MVALRGLLVVSLGILLSGCVTTVAGNGRASDGAPVTARYSQEVTSSSTFTLDLLIVAANGAQCQSRQTLPLGQTIWTLALTCSDGRTGSATLTADYINARDTVLYRLSGGESGRLVFGAGLLVVEG